MGSDPQSHLEEQNFLLIGKRKIRERDWRDVIEDLGAIEVDLAELGAMSDGVNRSNKLALIVLKFDRLRSSMKGGVRR